MGSYRAFVSPVSLSDIVADAGHGLDRETAHRFKSVLRLRSGDAVELFDGEGRVVKGSLNLADRVSFDDVKIATCEPEQPRITVVQAVVKMEKLEQIVQRCTELGVSEFVLFDAERSMKVVPKIDRLVRIAQDAARQSERVFVPQIRGPISLDDMPSQLSIVGDPDAQISFASWLQQADHLSQNLSIIVGPEGGLSSTEMQMLRDHDVTAVKWARHVLRTETAAMAAVSVVEALTIPQKLPSRT